MKIYVVNNKDGVIMGMFSTKRKAKKLLEIGAERWDEVWTLEHVKVDKIAKWILDGCEGYRKWHRGL